MTRITDTRNWQVSINDPTAKVEGAEDIAQCVYAIITTIEGSDPLRPDFGSKVYLYLDKPIKKVQPQLIYNAVEAVGRWEKRIAVTKCRLEMKSMEARGLVIEATVVKSAAQITINVNL